MKIRGRANSRRAMIVATASALVVLSGWSAQSFISQRARDDLTTAEAPSINDAVTNTTNVTEHLLSLNGDSHEESSGATREFLYDAQSAVDQDLSMNKTEPNLGLSPVNKQAVARDQILTNLTNATIHSKLSNNSKSLNKTKSSVIEISHKKSLADPLEARNKNISLVATAMAAEKEEREGPLSAACSYLYHPGCPFNGTIVASQQALIHPNSTCNCLITGAQPSRCCSRQFFCSHKMGHVLTAELFNKKGFRFGGKIRRSAHGYRQIRDTSALIGKDYRDVILIRNIYSALVSGYLYHKSGKECWLDPMGQPTGKETAPIKAFWDTQYVDPSYKPSPPSYGRDLCTYLIDVDELSGMRAYMEWVFHVHYRGIANQWRFSQSSPYHHRGRTLFVCLQQLTDPARDEATLHAILDWFFPAGDAPTTKARTASETPYDGPHATNHNATLRSHLEDVIKKVDREHFNGGVAFFHSILPC